MTADILCGDALAMLRTLPDASVRCCVTSPPYWGLRDYGHDGQLGLEKTPEEYVANMVAVFREVRRVLADDGTLWLNLGDSYAASVGGVGNNPSARSTLTTNNGKGPKHGDKYAQGNEGTPVRLRSGLKPKDLVGIPWRVARALQEPYYTGTIRDERDRVWLAAMLDAEGCMFIHKRKAGQHNGQGYYRKNDSYGPGVEISNTSLAVVERIMDLVGKGSICSQGPDQNGRRKQTIYRWNLRTTECRDFVRELYPYLVAKKQQARILIGCPSSGELADAAHAGLISLHRSGASDVDFPEPSSMYEPGWYLRSEIIWSKANPMPESVTDRPTKAHEQVFLLSKRATYFWDQEGVREEHKTLEHHQRYHRGSSPTRPKGVHGTGAQSLTNSETGGCHPSGRNPRTVWTIATQPFSGAHFAVMPPELARRCILAGSSEKGRCSECGKVWERVVERGYTSTGDHVEGRCAAYSTGSGRNDKGGVRSLRGQEFMARRAANPNRDLGFRPTCPCNAPREPDVILDPFAGAGTTGLVACQLGRSFIGIELNPANVAMAERRIRDGGWIPPEKEAPAGAQQEVLFS